MTYARPPTSCQFLSKFRASSKASLTPSQFYALKEATNCESAMRLKRKNQYEITHAIH